MLCFFCTGGRIWSDFPHWRRNFSSRSLCRRKLTTCLRFLRSIAQVSDLHNAEFGDRNQRLLEMLREAEPDMIAITGDLIDSRKANIAVALAFAEEAVKIAPCYLRSQQPFPTRQRRFLLPNALPAFHILFPLPRRFAYGYSVCILFYHGLSASAAILRPQYLQA